MSALFEARGVSIDYGGVHANRDVKLSVAPGKLVGLIGPNGAGKTSFIDAASGFTQPSAGTVWFDGRDITRLSAHKRNALGMCRTFQAVELFDDLTVLENLLVAAEPHAWWTPAADLFRPRRHSTARDTALEALESVGLAEMVDWMPSQLSHGQRKLVGVARSLSARPKMILFDEPAAGLDTEESEELGKTLRGLAENGLAILLIDHDMGLVLNVCDEIYVLDFGRVIGYGTPEEIKSDSTVIAAYLGGEAEAPRDGEKPWPVGAGKESNGDQ
jgi:branched-chain amino acid transport system ATP-binding protein